MSSVVQRRTTELAAGLWLLIGLAGCVASGPRDPYSQRNLPVPSGICLPTATIRDFRATSSTELHVRTGDEDWQYRVVLDRPCSTLISAQRIGWTSQEGLICDYRHDPILVAGERCAIGRIEDYKVDPVEAGLGGAVRP